MRRYGKSAPMGGHVHAIDASAAILDGVGLEEAKYMSDMFSPVNLAAMHRIRMALGARDLMNSCKVLPREGPHICLMHPARHVPQ